jgi:hypothetical protein
MGGTIVDSDHDKHRFPLMSFNAYHHTKLKWFDSTSLKVVSPTTSVPEMRVIAFADYDVAMPGETVVVQVGDYYLQYNRAHKFNASPYECANALTIVTPTSMGTELVGSLSTNGDRLFTRNGVTIELCSEHVGTDPNTPDYMMVSLGESGGCFGSTETGTESNGYFPDKKDADFSTVSKEQSLYGEVADRGGLTRRRLKGTVKRRLVQ